MLSAQTPASIESQNDRFALHYWTGAGLLCLGYTIVLMATAQRSLIVAFSEAVANVAPPAVLGLFALPAWKFIRGLRSSARLWAGLAAAGCFTFACLVLVPFTLAGAGALRGAEFTLMWFESSALIWQGFQSLLLFGLVGLAVIAHELTMENTAQRLELETLRSRQQQVPAVPDVPREGVRTLLVRVAEGLQSISVSEIFAIEADDDAAILKLRNGNVRTRLNLASLEQQLNPDCFVRVHRSWIINLPEALSIEPVGGGRMMAFFPGGLEVPISRTGAKLIRSRQA
ncbi:MAG: LytTR family DNA-binding domain-containing protein [Parvularculaceae bacterium]|nr:LytTR family DNA-binding domain-containing protein [Parvularculaceae bacterium]